MGITALPGAFVMFGQAAPGPNYTTDYNDTAAPSVFYQGAMLLDSRVPFTYYPGQPATQLTYGWYGLGGSIPLIDQVPTVISTNSVAQIQVPVSGTALTLTASNSANVTINQTITNARNGASVTGLRVIDSAMTTTTFGANANIVAWSPATAISRQMTIYSSTATAARDDSAGTYSIAGFDIYGYPMSETLTGSSIGGTITTQKAWKYIASITPGGTINSTGIIVGVNDVYGIPLRTDNGAYINAYFNNATVITSSEVTAASTVTATSTTADIRGVWSSSTASDGTRRLVMFWSPKTANMTSNEGIFGVVQYSTGTYTITQ